LTRFAPRWAGGWRAAALLLAVVVSAGAGCAKKLPPPGGRPDQEPPTISAMIPDSGSTGVGRSEILEVAFTESMNQRITDDWIYLAPYAKPGKLKWKGKAYQYELAETLKVDQTYAFIVDRGARDQRGNLIPGPVVSHFTTGDSFPPGVVAGEIEARGHSTRDVYVWGYRNDLGHSPDSTARDFDAFAVTRREGGFSMPGLRVPSTWKLFAFHDVNRNLTFEPGTDHLTEYPELVELSSENPLADTLHLMSIDPAAPATLEGTVVDSLAPGVSLGLRVELELEAGGEEVIEVAVAGGDFRLPISAGKYRLWVFLDWNRNARFNEATETKSETLEGVVSPGDKVTDLKLIAPAPPPGESEPGDEGEGP
jgi:hypothetical protein